MGTVIYTAVPFSLEENMENNEKTYSVGGSFETTIGKTQYEVVMNFKDKGMSMQEKALRIVKEESEKNNNSA